MVPGGLLHGRDRGLHRSCEAKFCPERRNRAGTFSCAPAGHRFHTGLTADCTKLDIKDNTDMIQIRPAFGGNIMAQITISRSRPQFATVRYRVMEKAKKVENPDGEIIRCKMTDDMVKSSIEILSAEVLEKKKSLEEEDIIVVAGRGAKNETGVALCRELADALGGQLAFTRPW